LSPTDNVHLVSTYDKSNGKLPPETLDQVKAMLQKKPLTEVHVWTLVNGTWMRNEANAVLIQK